MRFSHIDYDGDAVYYCSRCMRESYEKDDEPEDDYDIVESK